MPIPHLVDLQFIPLWRPTGPPACAVGVILADGFVAWGDAIGDDAPTAAEATDHLRPLLWPLLANQPADDFGRLCGLWAGLTITQTTTATVPTAAPAVANPSRRLLLRGFQPEVAPQTTQTITTTHRLPAAVRYALSQACLCAAAHAHGRTPVAQLRAEDGQTGPLADVPLMAPVAQVENPALLAKVAAVAYALPAGDSAALIGREGEKLQRYVRELGQWLGQTAARPTAIYLDTQGHLSTVYNDKAGKLLGALSGLEKAAAPHPLWIANLSTTLQAAETTASVREFLRLRRLTTQLVAADSAVVEATPAQFGSLADWPALLAAHTAVVLRGHPHETPHSAALLLAMAQAFPPAFWHVADVVAAVNGLQKLRLA